MERNTHTLTHAQLSYSCFENGLSFDREKVELTPNEVQNTALQYAGWGPKGQQLVRESQTHLYHRCVTHKKVNLKKAVIKYHKSVIRGWFNIQ